MAESSHPPGPGAPRRPAASSQFVDLLEQWRSATASRPSDPGPGLGPACHAILLLAGQGELDAVPLVSRQAWGALIQACQKPGNELFEDQAAGKPVRAHLLSCLAMQALDAAGLAPRDRPVALLEADVAGWLAQLDWSQPVAASEQIMLRLMWLVFQAENQSDASAMQRFHAALTWLNQAQGHETGLWGLAQGATLGDAVVAAPRLLAFSEYVRQPVRHVRQLIDTVLELLAQGRLPGQNGAEATLSAAWLLAVYHNQFNYRRNEIGEALERIEAALPTDAGSDIDLPSNDGTLGPMAPEGQPIGIGVVPGTAWLEAAWSSRLTRVIIAQTRPDGPTAGWRFPRRPGPGYFPRSGLSPHERQVLPLWLGPARPSVTGATPEPVVTTVIPVFNQGRYLPEAVESVLAQSFQEVEILVIDDGSTDEFTRLLLEHLHPPRARLLRQANQGVAAARNRGISEARGRYICCLDADDRLRPTYFDRAVAILDADPAVGFVTGGMHTFDGAKRLVQYPRCGLPTMLAENQAVQPAMFRRSAWEALGGYCTTFSVSGIEDWDLWIGLLGHGYRAAVISEVIFDYRILPESMATRMYEPNNWAHLVQELVARHAALYQRYLPDVVGQNAGRIAELLAWGNNRERARAWWERQARIWQETAEQREQMLNAQKAWSHELQVGKDWLEQQLHAWRTAAAERGTEIAQLKDRIAGLTGTMEQLEAQPDYSNTPVSPRRPSYGYAPADPDAPPAVSIVTPYFNTGTVFEETARSVLQQSFQQWEWLIINDGSTDPQYLAQLEPYRTRDPRIRVIDHDQNRGLSAARNTGYRHARTPYVALLDSDDLLEPTAIEKWVWCLESYPEYAFVKGYTVGFGAQQYLWDKGFHNGAAFLDDNQVDSTSLIRRTVLEAAGGYDESNRGGLEDWDFWLRCADRGFWGGTIPEFHDWYRRRPTHSDRWDNWDEARGMQAFRAVLRQRYPRLWQGAFPRIELRWHLPNAPVSDELPFHNHLAAGRPRLLLLLPYLTVGGADKFDLDLVGQLVRRGWEVTVVTTLTGDHSWLPRLSALTPDVFALHRFLRLVDYPRFLRYLIQSRQIEAVLISNSELGYLLLPYLRAHAPQAVFLDYCHMEEENWKSGGYPAMAVEHQGLLDLNLVSSQHLREWMFRRGADTDRIKVCHTNIDADLWAPDQAMRQATRQELGLDQDTPVLLYCGRLSEQKQPRVFAQTMLRLQTEGLRFAALVGGDGPDAAWLKRFVDDQGLAASVSLLGAIPPERIRQLLTAADVFFLPSRWEGIALSIFEAMAVGLPVVAADVGGQRELVTPECGVLVPRGDEQSEVQRYTMALAELLRDPQRGQAMGAAGRQRIQVHFRLDRMGETIEACLEQARSLQRTQPRPTPDLDLGRVCAAQAVEYIRISQLADQLWAERHGLQPATQSRSWRRQLYQRLYRWHEPYYRWYSKRGWTWLTPVRETLKHMLLRGPDQD